MRAGGAQTEAGDEGDITSLRSAMYALFSKQVLFDLPLFLPAATQLSNPSLPKVL